MAIVALVLSGSWHAVPRHVDHLNIVSALPSPSPPPRHSPSTNPTPLSVPRCAMAGFLSPANRGGLLTATVLLFMLMGVPAGYYSSLTYKHTKGAQWKSLTLATATFYPGVPFSTSLDLDFGLPPWLSLSTSLRTLMKTIPDSPTILRPSLGSSSFSTSSSGAVAHQPLSRARRCSRSSPCGSASRCHSSS